MATINFKKWDTTLGWAVFVIALITYAITREPSVSAWDCGEYISTSVKLEVGHPPGAPLFQMLGAFFALFAGGAYEIAKMVNLMSATASALTILFMFWTITNLAKKMVLKNGELSGAAIIAILGSGLVGSLAYTFSDSFWFSAVEGEVYASSSFLMALLFWLGLKWETKMNAPQGNKWLLVICFVVGLSFGVHILSLLVIPAIVMLYFFKMYHNITIKTTLIAAVIATLILAFVFKFLFPFTLEYFSRLELFFVNSLGMPFNSGSIIAGIVLIGLFYFGLRRTRIKGQVAANTLILGILFIMIGFSSWMMLPIRANADTTINENDPSNARELLAYYNREQYGDANVFYDTYYSIKYDQSLDADEPYIDGVPKYEKDEAKGKYVIVNDYKKTIPNYSSKNKGFIPRMVDGTREANYKAIAGIPANAKRRPTFGENLKYMFSFQFGYMYGRYFMWNFVGRQNDNQGNLDIFNGNWLSGIKFIDEARLGSQTNLPDDVKQNKGRNTYYFLPLIFGLIGLLYQLKHDKKNFFALLLFFAFTGFAVIFYTNPRAFEVRERDYAVVGSFYIFAIWIGFGVLALYQYLKHLGNKKYLATAITLVALLAVPTIMASENWDDHDRSNRFTTRLNAQSYLASCDPNAILFTIGDNDTFPLWYMQEVEGYRRDIKMVNTSLFATDWYIDQMKRASYEAAPIPSQLTHNQYKVGSLDVIYYVPVPQLKDSVISISNFMKWIASDNPATFYTTEDGEKLKTYPTNKIRIPVNKAEVLKNGIVAQKDADKIVDYIDITISDRILTKQRILMLDIIANNDWKRPIYFTGGSNDDGEFLWMKDYLQLDGMSYKLVPIKTPLTDQGLFEMGRIDPEKMSANIAKLDWRNINDGKIYLDEFTKRNSISLRNNMMRLASAYIAENKLKKAEAMLDLSIDKMPIKQFEHYSFDLSYPQLYYQVGNSKKARAITAELIDIFTQKLIWYASFDDSFNNVIIDKIENVLMMYKRGLLDPIEQFDTDKEYTKKLQKDFMNTLSLFKSLMPDEAK